MSTQTEFTAWRPQDTLAARLVLLRRELGLSQRAAAFRAGVTFGEWQSMENGADARGIDKKVAKIAAAFDVDRDWLMWGGPLAEPGGPASRTVTPDRNDGLTTRQYLPDSADFAAAA